MRIFLIILLVIAASLGVASYFLADIVQARAIRWLDQHHVHVGSLTVSSVTPTSITLTDVALGKDNALRAKTITLAYRGGTSLPTLRVRIAADGLALKAVQSGKQWALGGVENIWGAEVAATTPTARVALQGTIDITGDAAKDIDGDVDFSVVNYSAGAQKITAKDVALDIATSGGTITLDGVIAQLLLQQNGAALLAPLRVETTLKHAWSGSSVGHKSTIADLEKLLRIDVVGQHDIAKNAGMATISTPELPFGQGAIILSQLAPGFAQGVATPPMTLKLDETAVTYAGAGDPSAKGTVQVVELPVGSLIAQALGKGASMEGTLKGSVPFIYHSKNDWRVDNARLQNDGPMKLTLLPIAKEISGFVSALSSVLKKKPLPQGDVNEVNVSTLVLQLTSTNNQGGMAVAGEVQGMNPLLKKPAHLKMNFVSSLSDLLRSMASSALKKAGD